MRVTTMLVLSTIPSSSLYTAAQLVFCAEGRQFVVTESLHATGRKFSSKCTPLEDTSSTNCVNPPTTLS